MKGGLAVKKLLCCLLAALLAVSFVGCGQEDTSPTVVDQDTLTGPLIGICLPEETAQWQDNAIFLQNELNLLGYPVEVVYGENDPDMQAEQMADFVEKQVAALIVAPVDSMALTEGLQAAEQAQIPVIAFDRQLMGTAVVDAFITFDYADMGRQVGDYIVKTMDLETAMEEDTTYTIELIMGAAEDDTALAFHAGLLAVLQPYLDAGVLESLSGRTSFADTYTQFADPSGAESKLKGYLDQFYKKQQPDILCFGSDEMAMGCAKLLSSYRWENPVLVTGMGGHTKGLEKVESGFLSATVYRNMQALAKRCAAVTDGLITGQVLTHDRMTDNQIKDVPTFLEESFLVNGDNFQEKIVKPGIYEGKD